MRAGAWTPAAEPAREQRLRTSQRYVSEKKATGGPSVIMGRYAKLAQHSMRTGWRGMSERI
jgi:hypothetical protein